MPKKKSPPKIKKAVPGKYKDPMWKGPYVDGITQSLLSNWMVCRERARIHLIEGLREEAFNEAMEFGSMWHEAEEALSKQTGKRRYAPCYNAARRYYQGLLRKYPANQWDIGNMMHRFRAMFPAYMEHWEKHYMTRNREPFLQEEVFRVPYLLPWNKPRVVILKGKWDAVDIITTKGKKEFWLQENKTKSRVDEKGLLHTLGMNMQTMFYLTALQNYLDTTTPSGETLHPIAGVLYNVVLRTSHRQGKKETPKSFMDRFTNLIQDEPNKFFMRWQVNIYGRDMLAFRTKCLDPILHQLCDWWEWVSSPEGLKNPFANPLHFQTPWGMYNSMFGGFQGDYFQYLTTGSDVSLTRVKTLFPEL